MKKMLVLALLMAAAEALAAVEWRGMGDGNHYSGPKIDAEFLDGKVVLVDCWGAYCPPCRALLPTMEKFWQRMKSKPFVLVGSHCQGREPEKVAALVKEHRLTYPIYERFGLAKDEPPFRGLPFMYVVDHRGKVVYAGRNEAEMEEAVEAAIKRIGGPRVLTGGVPLKKYKSFEKQLVLGKDIKRAVGKLESDVKKGASKGATAVMKEQAAEAQAILAAIQETKQELTEEIVYLKERKPEEARKLYKEFQITFPSTKRP